MNIEDSRWEAYERRFRALAEDITLHQGPQPELASSAMLLCLYGDNAMTSDQEFETLAEMEKAKADLKGAAIETSYWEDIVLYLP